MIKKNISGWIYNFHIFISSSIHNATYHPASHADQSHPTECCAVLHVLWTVTVQDPTFNVTSAGRTEHLYIQGQILNFKCIASTRDNLFRILSAQRSRRDKLINPRNGQELNTHVGESIENMPLFQTAYSFILIILYSFLSFYPSQLISVTPAKDKQDILDSWIEDRTFFTQ